MFARGRSLAVEHAESKTLNSDRGGDMKKLVTIGLVALALMAAPRAAQAAAIKGSIGFGGGFTPTGGTNLGNATGLHFVNPIIVTNPRSGDYAAVPAGTLTNFTDFTFNPASTPVVPLWSFTIGAVTYSFDLSSVTVVNQSKTFLNLTGTGILHITGFDDTPAIWTFSGTKAGASFSFGSDATAVAPEPASILMLGLGFLGTARAVRRRWSL
jgi:hypothetical protein